MATDTDTSSPLSPPASELLALTQLYQATNGGAWLTATNWPPVSCSAHGVSCSLSGSVVYVLFVTTRVCSQVVGARSMLAV